jgi:Na+/citrate or Na+/malate symporter
VLQAVLGAIIDIIGKMTPCFEGNSHLVKSQTQTKQITEKIMCLEQHKQMALGVDCQKKELIPRSIVQNGLVEYGI